MNKEQKKLKKVFAILVRQFGAKLLKKLMANETKYHFGWGWKYNDWRASLQKSLVEHTAKGDPKDVAILALFADYHGWPTAEPRTAPMGPITITLTVDGVSTTIETGNATKSAKEKALRELRKLFFPVPTAAEAFENLKTAMKDIPKC